jgi:hypothetical protein
VLVGLPGVLDDRALECEGLVDVQGVDVLGHGTAGVGLDNELEEAGLAWRFVSEDFISCEAGSCAYSHHW